MQAAGSPANMLHSRGQEQLLRPHCSMVRKSPLKSFQSGLRTSRLGTGHNGSTARLTQGLAACLGKSKQESYLHKNPNRKPCPPLAPLPPLCPVLQTQHRRLVLLSTELCRARRTGTWEGMEGMKPTAPPNMLQLSRDWRPRKVGGPLPSPEEPNACGPWPCYPLLPQAGEDLYENGGVQLRPCTGALAPFKGTLSVLGCIVHKTQGTEMNLLPSPTTGPGSAMTARAMQEVARVSDPALQIHTLSLGAPPQGTVTFACPSVCQ